MLLKPHTCVTENLQGLIVGSLDKMTEALDTEDYVEGHTAFHTLIQSQCHNCNINTGVI